MSSVELIQHIDSIFVKFADAILDAGPSQAALELRSRNQSATRRIAFPGRSPEEAWRFTVLIRILELIHEALVTHVVVSKRDIFYRQPALFGQQDVVDRYVDDIACTFGVSRKALNVSAVAKGLVAGVFSVQNGTEAPRLCSSSDGILVPSLENEDCIDPCASRWTLMVEKEATFRALVSSAFWKEGLGSGILITAKGYPDLCTRKFLCQLALQAPHLRFYGLVDFDPDGLAILSTYKYGSVGLAHERDTTVPSMEWLGLKSRDISEEASIHSTTGLLSLTKRDRQRARRMLSWSHIPTDFVRELQVMLMLNYKAEIQLLESTEGGLSGWLQKILT